MAWSTVQPFCYGMWTTGTGRQVMFDRSYEPLSTVEPQRP
jgi:hypothetical protein